MVRCSAETVVLNEQRPDLGDLFNSPTQLNAHFRFSVQFLVCSSYLSMITTHLLVVTKMCEHSTGEILPGEHLGSTYLYKLHTDLEAQTSVFQYPTEKE